MAMTYEDIVFTREEGVATITLNRPERLNAFGTAMRESLFQAVEEVRRDAETKVLIITGAGRAFCAGGDVSGQQERMSWDHSQRMRFLLSALSSMVPPLLRRLDKPVIAAVNGIAAGAGFCIALACDIRIASENARFSMAFVKRGIIPDSGGTWLLPRIVGVSKACELMFTGDTIDAKEAERIGVVSKVVPQEELMKETMELATKIAKGASIAIGLTKRAIYRGLECSFESQIDTEVYSNSICYLTEDHKEGVQAFFEKREPIFKGR